VPAQAGAIAAGRRALKACSRVASRPAHPPMKNP